MDPRVAADARDIAVRQGMHGILRDVGVPGVVGREQPERDGYVGTQRLRRRVAGTAAGPAATGPAAAGPAAARIRVRRADGAHELEQDLRRLPSRGVSRGIPGLAETIHTSKKAVPLGGAHGSVVIGVEATQRARESDRWDREGTRSQNTGRPHCHGDELGAGDALPRGEEARGRAGGDATGCHGGDIVVRVEVGGIVGPQIGERRDLGLRHGDIERAADHLGELRAEHRVVGLEEPPAAVKVAGDDAAAPQGVDRACIPVVGWDVAEEGGADHRRGSGIRSAD